MIFYHIVLSDESTNILTKEFPFYWWTPFCLSGDLGYLEIHSSSRGGNLRGDYIPRCETGVRESYKQAENREQPKTYEISPEQETF